MYKDIIDKCNSNRSGYYIKESGFKKTWPNVYRDIINYPFNGELNDKPFKIKLWHYLHQDFNIPRRDCGNSLDFKNFRVGYRNFCSTNCKCMAAYSNKKRKQSSVKKYGVDHPMKLNENRNRIRDIKLGYSEEKKEEINEKKKKTYLKNYGVDNPNKDPNVIKKRVKTFKDNIKKWKESYRESSLERYGADHPWSSQEVRKNFKKTMIKKYGEDNANKVKQLRDKIKETNKTRYGHEYSFQSKVVKEKIKKTFLKRYGVTNPSHLDEVKNKISKGVKKSIEKKLQEKYNDILSFNEDTTLTVKCDTKNCLCGGSYIINRGLYFQRMRFGINPCIKSNPITNIGILQSTLSDFILGLGLGIDIEKNDRSILGGKEIDIWIPSKRLGIEFNGLYWHSELFKDKGYHQNKTNEALLKDIDILHVWEDDWLYKRPIVKSMIKSKLGLSKFKIGARKCQIKEVSSQMAKEFLNTNHLQGNVNSSVRLGLFYKNEIVSLMTLGKKRKTLNQKHTKGEWELYRFANKLDTNVQGGFSKLLGFFVQSYNPNTIHTYANYDHSMGNVYLKNGFSLDHLTSPGYSWVIDGIRRHRFNFTKQKLVKEGANSNLTETEIMHARGHYRVWDSGNLKFELKLD